MAHTWTPLEKSLEVLGPLADPYVGIVRREFMKLRDVDDIWSHSYGSQGTDTEILFGIKSNSYNGGGSDSQLAARLASIGETVERYSSIYCPRDEETTTFGSQKELIDSGKKVLGFDSWELFADEQFADKDFPHKKWDMDTKLWWREGEESRLNQKVWTPAQLIHLSGVWPNEPFIGLASSNGLACGITFTEAALSGLFEAVERDAFMLTWYNRLSLPLVNIDSSERLKKFHSRYIAPTHLKLSLVDMTVFSGIPSVLAVVENTETNFAPLALGAASAHSLERACEKAATEAMYTRTWMKAEQREGNALKDVDLTKDIRSFEDHIKLYAGTEFVQKAKFLVASDKRVNVNEVKSFSDSSPIELWERLLDHLYNLKHRVVTFDLTSPDIREAGAYVVKVVIPGFRPLDAMHHGRMMGGNRLLEHAYNLNLVEKPFTLDELNQDPHPFP